MSNQENNEQKEFAVIAGKYCEFSHENNYENIKFASGPLSFTQALETAKEYKNYPFCYITYKDQRLSLES